MKKSQEEIEAQVFSRFASNEKLPLKIKNWEHCIPREPDILCSLEDNSKQYFELTDNTDFEIRKTIGARKSSVKQRGYIVSSFPKQYKKKFSKPYEINGLRCDLLIYFGLYPVEFDPKNFERNLNENIGWMIMNIFDSPFHRVWIYDYDNDVILKTVDNEPTGLSFTTL